LKEKLEHLLKRGLHSKPPDKTGRNVILTFDVKTTLKNLKLEILSVCMHYDRVWGKV